MDEVKGLELGTGLVVSLCNMVILNDRYQAVRQDKLMQIYKFRELFYVAFKGTLDHCCFDLRCSCRSCFDLNLDLLLHCSRNLLFLGCSMLSNNAHVRAALI